MLFFETNQNRALKSKEFLFQKEESLICSDSGIMAGILKNYQKIKNKEV